jgi:hypothetical protein
VPGQAVGLAVLVAVLAAALASVPLMIGSAEEGAWQRERARHEESAIGTTFFSFLAARQAGAHPRPPAQRRRPRRRRRGGGDRPRLPPPGLPRPPARPAVRRHAVRTGTGVLLASHDPVVVAAADRVVRLSDGQVVEG